MAPPGVYLLAYKGALSDKEEENGRVYLISVSVDKDGNAAYKAHLETQAVRHTRPQSLDNREGRDWFGAEVEFAGRRANVTLAAPEADGRYRTYGFQLDLVVIMK